MQRMLHRQEMLDRLKALLAHEEQVGRRGLRMELGQRTGSAPGSLGIVRLQPVDWLPDHIELPVQVLAEAASGNGGHYLWLRLNNPGTALEMALERHLVRLHRRQIANSRRA